MMAGVAIHARFEKSLFIEALKELVARQESLRTTFASPEGEPRQLVASWIEPTVIEHDLTGLPADQRLAEARRIAAALAARPFDLERGPLWWTLLIRLADDNHVLVIGSHHIVGDLWSFGVFGQELSAYYNSKINGAADVVLEPLPVQYADYAIWQREWLEGGRIEQQMRYWTRQLAGLAPLEIAGDRPRPPFVTGRGD